MAKLALVSGMVLFHIYCGSLFRRGQQAMIVGHPMFSFGAVVAPIVLITSVLWLVLGKPLVPILCSNTSFPPCQPAPEARVCFGVEN